MVMEGEEVKQEQAAATEETMGATEVGQEVKAEEDDLGDITEANAVKFFHAGRNEMDAGDFDEATDALAKALQLRVRLYGELAPECAHTYYVYGCALLQKVQSERDALGDTQEAGTSSEPVDAEGDDEPTEAQDNAEQGSEPAAEPKAVEAENGHEDGDDVQDEEESELELAWKVMDIARVIYEKQRTHSLDEVDVHLALADISLEKEDFETCFQDYNKALEILKGLVEPDNRRLAEAYFKIALAQQFAKAPTEAITYCQQAVSVCELRVERLKREIASDDPDKNAKEEEVKEMGTLLADLNEKVEELKTMANTPSILDALKDNKVLAETLRTAALEAASEAAKKCGESTSTSTSSDAVVGVVGRGIKRAAPVPVAEESCSKRLETES